MALGSQASPHHGVRIKGNLSPTGFADLQLPLHTPALHIVLLSGGSIASPRTNHNRQDPPGEAVIIPVVIQQTFTVIGCRLSNPALKPCLSRFLAVWPQATYLTSLGLVFFFFPHPKMGTLIIPAS